jgi:hypothetical protein
MRARLREDNFKGTFVGVVSCGRRGLRWHRLWSMHQRRIRWDQIRSCAAERDTRPGIPRHTIRLGVEHEGGLLEVMLAGPSGALALAELQDRIRDAAHLPSG